MTSHAWLLETGYRVVLVCLFVETTYVETHCLRFGICWLETWLFTCLRWDLNTCINIKLIGVASTCHKNVIIQLNNGVLDSRNRGFDFRYLGILDFLYVCIRYKICYPIYPEELDERWGFPLLTLLCSSLTNVIRSPTCPNLGFHFFSMHTAETKIPILPFLDSNGRERHQSVRSKLST